MNRTPEQRVEETRKFILDNWDGFEKILRHNNWKVDEDDSTVVNFFHQIDRTKGDISDFINKLKVMISGDNWYTFYRRLMLNEGTRVEIGFEMFQENCVNDDVLRNFVVHYTDCDITPLTSEINKINKNHIKGNPAMYTKFNVSEFDSKLDEFLEYYGFDTAKTIDKLEKVLRKNGNKKTQRFKSHSLESLYLGAKRKIEHVDYQDYRKTVYFRAEDLKICINHALAEMFLPSLEWKDIEDAY